MELTAERLRELLSYDPETGVFTRRIATFGHSRGEVVGSTAPNGWNKIKLEGGSYRASRLAFLYMTGRWPTPQVDHVNRVRGDERWANLREVTTKQQAANKTPGAPGSLCGVSGFGGVSWRGKLR